MYLKNVRWVIFCNLEEAWTDLRNFRPIIIPISCTRTDNFSSHPSCVATLPKNTHGQPNRHLFSSAWVALERRRVQLTTDEFQFSLKFQVLTNNCDWSIGSSTRSHYAQFMACLSLDASDNWTGVL